MPNPWFEVAGYTPADYQGDLRRLQAMLARHARVTLSIDGVTAATLQGLDRCTAGASDRPKLADE
jgi:hypothetical protein